jgi:hypothetical protein
MDELYELQDKYVTIFYTSNEDKNLTDMELDGISLFGEYALEEDYSSHYRASFSWIFKKQNTGMIIVKK